MANISTAAKLSKRYTNHCVRTTALERFTENRRNKSIVMKTNNEKTNNQQVLQNVILESQTQGPSSLAHQNPSTIKNEVIEVGSSTTSKSTSTNNSRLPSHESNEISSDQNQISSNLVVPHPQRLTNDFQIMSSNSSNGANNNLAQSKSSSNHNQIQNNVDHFGLYNNNIHHQMSQMSQIGQMGHENFFVSDSFGIHDEHDVMNNFQAL